MSQSAPAPTLREVIQVLDELWPRHLAESWDRVGLVTGRLDREIARIRLVVDVVDQTVTEALEAGDDLIIAHHPLLLRGVTSLGEHETKGHLVASLIRSNIAVFSAHTNADAVDGGTSERLGAALGLQQMRPIAANENSPASGIGRVGQLPEPIRLYDLASRVAALVPQTAAGVKVSGDADQMVNTIALCTGAGDSLLTHPDVLASDAYITGDLRHHPASDAEQARLLGQGPALVDVSHFASEWFFLDDVAKDLRSRLPGVSVSVSDTVTDPWTFVIHSG